MGMAYSDEEKRIMWQKEADKKGMHFIQKYIQLEDDLKALVKKWPESIPTDAIEALLLHHTREGMMSNRALCLLCGTDLKDGKPVIVDDLRTLVERWEDEDRNDTYRTPLSRPAQLRKLLKRGGVMIIKDKYYEDDKYISKRFEDRLWKHMHEEHGLYLLESELEDIRVICRADLRKLVVELKDVQDIYPGLHNVIAKIEKLIRGE